MNIKRAKEEIEHTVKAYLAKDALGEYAIPAIRQRPILLMGPPGIGKTQIMEQAARECGVALVAYTITHHTRQSAVGLPFIRQRHYGDKDVSVTEYTMSEIIASVYAKMEATGLKEGILFIDEINCVSETLAPTMLQFLQCKTFGNQAVPAGWVIVAAGNPPEYNKSVRDFDIVTLDRVRRMDIEPDLQAWKDYARTARIHSAILSYLDLHPQNFYQINADVDGTQFVTARGWEDLSNLLDTYEALGLKADESLIRQYLQHEKIAEDFSAYLDLYYKYRDDYGVEEILAGQAKPAVFARLLNAPFDERLSLVSLILSGLNNRFTASRQQVGCFPPGGCRRRWVLRLPAGSQTGLCHPAGGYPGRPGHPVQPDDRRLRRRDEAPAGGRAAEPGCCGHSAHGLCCPPQVGSGTAPRQCRGHQGSLRAAPHPVPDPRRRAGQGAGNGLCRAGSCLRLHGSGFCGRAGDGGLRHRADAGPRRPCLHHRKRLRPVLPLQQRPAAGSPQGRLAAGAGR